MNYTEALDFIEQTMRDVESIDSREKDKQVVLLRQYRLRAKSILVDSFSGDQLQTISASLSRLNAMIDHAEGIQQARAAAESSVPPEIDGDFAAPNIYAQANSLETPHKNTSVSGGVPLTTNPLYETSEQQDNPIYGELPDLDFTSTYPVPPPPPANPGGVLYDLPGTVARPTTSADSDYFDPSGVHTHTAPTPPVVASLPPDPRSPHSAPPPVVGVPPSRTAAPSGVSPSPTATTAPVASTTVPSGVSPSPAASTVVSPPVKSIFWEVDVDFKAEKLEKDNVAGWLASHAGLTASAPGSEAPGLEISGDRNGETKYRHEKLSPSQVIIFTAEFRGNTCVLEQDYTGKVKDMTSKATHAKLSDKEKVRLAFEMAQRLLFNYNPEMGTIVIRNGEKDQADRVYAALLLLKPEVKVKSYVPGCDGPKYSLLRSNKNSREEFINAHLGSITKNYKLDQQNKVRDFSAELERLKNEHGGNLSAIPEEITPPSKPRRS